MVDVVIPKIGEIMETGIVAAWLVPDASFVQKGEPLFEMEIDKASVVVDAGASGYVRQLVAEGTELPVGALIARIDPVGASDE